MNKKKYISSNKESRQEDNLSMKDTMVIKQKVNLHSEEQNRKSSMLPSKVAPWLGALIVIVSFFWLQVRLDQLPKDWAHETLLYTSVIVEFALLSLLNSLWP